MRIGKVSHLSSSQHLIVKMEEASPPPLGSKVLDNNLRVVGSISDIFGPTSAPYVSIRPYRRPAPDLVGAVVYAPDSDGG
ncbi:MAG: Gar1/Naf1 family protein [Candidatus Bathyarchaeia archaeon]